MPTKPKNYIDVTYDNGTPAKMLNIFFGTVLIETPSGSKFWIDESRLDHDWRNSQNSNSAQKVKG